MRNKINKLLLLGILLSAGQMVSAQEFVIRMPVKDISSPLVYNEFGFNQNGTHQETGTKYNPDGYDFEGYNPQGFDDDGWNSDGIGEVICYATQENSSYYYAEERITRSTLGGHTNYKVRWANQNGRANNIGTTSYITMDKVSSQWFIRDDKKYAYTINGDYYWSRPWNGSSSEKKSGICRTRTDKYVPRVQ